MLKDGSVLAAGGARDRARASAEVYDPSTGTWTPTGRMTHGRTFHTATLLSDGQVLVVGGRDDKTRPLESAEVYDPATGTWSSR